MMPPLPRRVIIQEVLVNLFRALNCISITVLCGHFAHWLCCKVPKAC